MGSQTRFQAYFEAHSLEALCTADFGKVMKHVFPGVRARRLGERGKTFYDKVRHLYWGHIMGANLLS